MIKVSVIIPVYNVEKYLERCLESVINQTLKDIEIICVNDGSTDNSRTILKKYENLSNLKIVEQKNSGLSVARNSGLYIASGEYVAFLDSDDFIDNNFYELLYNAAKEKDADVSCASIVRENNKKKTVLFEYTKTKFTTDIKEKFLLAKSPKYNFVWNKIYRRKFLLDNSLYFVPGLIYEDMCFTADVLETSNVLVVIPNTFYHYWKHSNTLIKGDSDKSRADKLLGYKYLMDKCRKYNVTFNNKNELQYKRDFKIFGVNILKEYSYRATRKYLLFGIIPIIEIQTKV